MATVVAKTKNLLFGFVYHLKDANVAVFQWIVHCRCDVRIYLSLQKKKNVRTLLFAVLTDVDSSVPGETDRISTRRRLLTPRVACVGFVRTDSSECAEK